MRIYAEKGESVEGRTLIIVRWEREGDSAATPTVEAIYEVFVPSGMFTDVPYVLTLLSTTRVDTRVSITMTEDEREFVTSKAAEFGGTLIGA